MNVYKNVKDNLVNIILLVIIIAGGIRLFIISSDGGDSKKVFNNSSNTIATQKDVESEDAKPIVGNVAKQNNKPVVELFVMSHCPYGTQIEKGILPVAKALDGKIDFQIKFTDYAMHGEKELKEQLNQYCIQKEQPKKFVAYLEAFLKEGNFESSLEQSGVDKEKLANCVAKTDKEYKVLENFNNKIGFKGSYPGFEVYKDDNKKYDVAGSPTLVINGAQNESGRDSNSLLKSICSAFNNPPKECNSVLSSATPAPGFGAGTQAGSASAGGCQ